jgi:hypothetical protein
MGLKEAIAPTPTALTVTGSVPDPAALSLDVEQWSRRTATSDDSPASNLSVEDKAEAEQRFSIIEPLIFPAKFPKLWQDCNGRKGSVEHALKSQHGTGTRTIREWEKHYKLYGMQGLVRWDREDKGIFKSLNEAAKRLIFGLAVPKKGGFGALSVKEIFRQYEDERAWRDSHIGQAIPANADKYAAYLDEDRRLSEKCRLPKVALRTVARYVKSISEAVRTIARDGEEAYRNTQEIISHRALTAIDPLQFLVMDHRLLDVFCLVPIRGGWRLARPWLTAAIDMRTRKWLGWGTFETPSSDSIATVLKKVFIQHGVPQSAYFDNGVDFRCEYIEGKRTERGKTGPVGDLNPAWRGILGTLGVKVTHAIVRNARAKIIEPNFVRIANFDRTLPEYCGHKPTARPERFEAMVKQHEAWTRGERPASPFRTIQQIAALYDSAIADLNERELQGDGMQKITATGRVGWMSPAECWDKLIGNIERRTVRTEDLAIAFSKRKMLTVKHGEICAIFGGDRYHYRLEAEPMQLMAINGQLVEIAFDPHDLGGAAVYWRDQFIGLAHCAPLRKMGEDAFVEDERNRRHGRKTVKEFIEAVHQLVPVVGPEERLARRREVLAERPEACRPEAPIALPTAMQKAADAMRADREFSFKDAVIDLAATPATIDDDSDFRFFSDQGD